MIKYRQASFRGITFEIESRSYSSGRRLQVHEYPNKDIPYTEDMGKKHVSYSITAFIIGRNYKEKRDKLRIACIEKDPGILIHPDYGSLEVIVESISIKESRDQGGMAVFDLTFVEAGIKALPETSIDHATVLLNSSENMRRSVLDNFSISSSIETLTDGVGSLADGLTDVLEEIGSGLEYANDLSCDIKDAMNKIVDISATSLQLKTDAKHLLNTPNALGAQINTIFSAIRLFSGNNINSFTRINDLKAKKIDNEINLFTNEMVIVNEAELITEIDFETIDDANYILHQFMSDIEELEYQENIELPNEVIWSLRELREKVITYINKEIINSNSFKIIKLNEETPSNLLSYNLYGTLDRADEICKYNKIKYPAFIPAGVELRVKVK